MIAALELGNCCWSLLLLIVFDRQLCALQFTHSIYHLRGRCLSISSMTMLPIALVLHVAVLCVNPLQRQYRNLLSTLVQPARYGQLLRAPSSSEFVDLWLSESFLPLRRRFASRRHRGALRSQSLRLVPGGALPIDSATGGSECRSRIGGGNYVRVRDRTPVHFDIVSPFARWSCSDTPLTYAIHLRLWTPGPNRPYTIIVRSSSLPSGFFRRLSFNRCTLKCCW